jgi:tRNA-splicing ligase RtcB
MSHQLIDSIPVWGTPLPDAVAQMKNCLRPGAKAALMADHHLGYAVPVGGVIAYPDHISPSAVGFDIGCGNTAWKLSLSYPEIKDVLPSVMDEIVRRISFGVGRKNPNPVEHPIFDDPLWSELPMLGDLKDMARAQLGTVGSGNHYVDLFRGEDGHVWIGVHFGSRGLGHKIASHFIKAGGGKDGVNVDPVLLYVDSDLGVQYEKAMELAGEYARVGRFEVCLEVTRVIRETLLRTPPIFVSDMVENHHNFSWRETHRGVEYCVARKGATPAFPGQRGFVGATMAEPAAIIRGLNTEENKLGLYSAVHGAGRVLSRTAAAGKSKWIKGVKTRVSEGCVPQSELESSVNQANVVLRGAGVDEAPRCYKRLDEVLEAHSGTFEVLEQLVPIGVAMAGANEIDPYKD